MDLNRVCVSLVAVHCLWILIQRPGWAWAIKSLAILGLLGGMWYWNPEWAGTVAVGPWLVLILLPIMMQQATLRMIRTRRLKSALWMSRGLRVLHPVPETGLVKLWVRVIQKIMLLDLEAARKLMASRSLSDQSLEAWMHIIAVQTRGAWDELEDWVDAQWQGPGEGLTVLIGVKLTALAERRDWVGLIELVGALSLSDHHDLLHLRTLSLLGDVTGVEDLLRSHGDDFPRESCAFWRGVALISSGRIEAGKTQLQQLRQWASPVLRLEIDRRLAVHISGPDLRELPPQSRAILDELRRHVGHEARYAVLSGVQPRWPLATGLVAVALLVAFGLEVRHGWDQSLDEATLASLGALLVPFEPPFDEWWRMLTYGLLHFGPLHLAFNLMGLYYLGRRVERGCGSIGMLVCFAVCVAVPGFIIAQWPSDEGAQAILVGASGGVMGLMGALMGILFLGRLRHSTERIRSQFALTVKLVVLQTAIDFSTPQISASCHLIGVATGILLGVVAGWWIGRGGGVRPFTRSHVSPERG